MFWNRKPDPEADPARLAEVGAAVRARLLADPRARPLGGHKADIFTLPDFLSAQRCRELIAQVEAQATPSTLFADGGRSTENVRTSSTHYFRDDPMAAKLGAEIDALLGLSRSHAEPMQGQRYRPGEEYRHHRDHFRLERDHWQRERQRGGQRTWTAMLYLNRVESGGATEFPKLGLAFKPETGTLLAWNNMDRRGKPNPATLHAGTSVGSGTKYVITQWYRLDRWHPAPGDRH